MGDFVKINVSNSQNDVVSFEKKFPRDIKIAELKVISAMCSHLLKFVRFPQQIEVYESPLPKYGFDQVFVHVKSPWRPVKIFNK